MDENKKLQKLAGIAESTGDDDTFMVGMKREKHVEALIRHAFEKIGLEINFNNYSLVYEDQSREARVTLEDFEFTLKHLNRLYETGLANDYTIKAGTDCLEVEFIVDAQLDNARIA